MITVQVNYQVVPATDVSWSSVDPGGYEACNFLLPKSADYPLPGQRVEVFDGLTTVWLGRVEEPGSNYDKNRVSGEVAAIGYGAIFKDDSMQVIFIDRDLGRLQGISVARQANVRTVFGANAFNPMNDFELVPDNSTGAPSLKFSVSGHIPGSGGGFCEAWYDAGTGNLISQVQLESTEMQNISGATWDFTVTSGVDDLFTGGSTSIMADQSDSSVAFRRDTVGTPRRFICFNVGYGSTYVGDENLRWRMVKNIAMIGNHGVTLQQVGAGLDGFYPDDIVEYVRTQVSGISRGAIEDSTSFTVLQSAYREPVPHEQIINDMAVLMGWHWGVWDSGSIYDRTPCLDFRQRPSDITATALLSECSGVTLSKSLSTMYNRAVVTYLDAVGVPSTVTVNLGHPDMPIGLTRTLYLDLGVSNSTNATTYGTQILQLTQRDARYNGSAVLSNTVQINGATKPSHMLKAGLDRLFIRGLQSNQWIANANANAFRIKRVASQQQGDGVVTTVELDGGADLIETLQARQAQAQFGPGRPPNATTAPINWWDRVAS